MLRNLKYRWPFAKKKPVAFLLQQPSKQSAAAATSLTLYQSCSKCPLDVFLDCLFDGDYKRLVIEGSITDEQLYNVWQNLYTEYCELSNGDGVSDHLELMKETNLLLSKAAMVDAAVACLRCYYDDELVAILEAFQLRSGITPGDDEETIQKKLEKVLVRAKKLMAQYDAKKQELQALENKNKKGSSRDEYEDSLAAISKEMGYHVRASEITVARFVRQSQQLKEKYLKLASKTK